MESAGDPETQATRVRHPLQMRGAQVVLVGMLGMLMSGQCWVMLPNAPVPTRTPSTDSTETAEIARSIRINLNTASESELTLLPGFGDKLVRDVIAYRNAHGDFHTWADVEAISGMGPLTIEAIRPWSNLQPTAQLTIRPSMQSTLPPAVEPRSHSRAKPELATHSPNAAKVQQPADPSGLSTWIP
ncbi:ComEA family DNA-binding protein [Neorhodopirellula lusitana]|uniref:ComEA family DNA-binding protein n=1 Tax=Neorhodopirellula lusitana TaxID=445327 RepID=UPI0038500F2F